ncbi:MAG: Crp/Fnr family transcriptional regulator [Chitinophagaceae bacterium]|jgi:CRP/FNR family transcriptional regulator|nr:Crp/Fnr family transcriptional regulator [Chitinophagaceae bacterium]
MNRLIFRTRPVTLTPIDMPAEYAQLKRILSFLDGPLLEAFAEYGDWVELGPGVQLLREGQYVKVVPIVLEGLVKVYTQTDQKELLLYFIQPKESCIMSLSAVMHNDPSKIFALTEEKSTLLLIPAGKITQWLKEFPRLNDLFYQQYDQRYAELIETIQQLLFNRLDQRIYEYLDELARLKGTRTLNIRHRQIAQDLGTAREVITRTLKKLEKEGKVSQVDGGIVLL